MKRLLTAAALALLCSGAPGTANDDPAGDVHLAMGMIKHSLFKPADCPFVAGTNRVGEDKTLVATCSNGAVFLIFDVTALRCPEKGEEARETACNTHPRRRLPTVIRGAN